MIEFYGQTDVGRRRALNEDSILTDGGLFLVCDGMGGHKAGEVASQLAVEAIAAFVERSRNDREMTWPYGFDPGLSFEANRLRTAIKLANRAIHRKAASGDDYTGMGTTVVAVIVSERMARITYAHVGDSRAYVLGGGALVQLTRDDSWANAEWGVDEAESASMKNILTKALGARDEVEFEVVDRVLEPGETIVLCSDGLTGMVSDERITEIIAANDHDLKQACGELIGEANANGGRDNVSVILIRHRS